MKIDKLVFFFHEMAGTIGYYKCGARVVGQNLPGIVVADNRVLASGNDCSWTGKRPFKLIDGK
jgi:hypothetical protein